MFPVLYFCLFVFALSVLCCCSVVCCLVVYCCFLLFFGFVLVLALCAHVLLLFAFPLFGSFISDEYKIVCFDLFVSCVLNGVLLFPCVVVVVVVVLNVLF